MIYLIRFVGIALCGLFVLATPAVGLADHSSPDRVIDDKYHISLILSREHDDMQLRFFFHEFTTGKDIEGPLKYRYALSAGGAATPFFTSPTLSVSNGIGESMYHFPNGGMYETTLEFWFADQPDMIYRPHEWSLWVPGTYLRVLDRYPLGYSEISGFLGVLAAAVVVLGTIWWHRKTGKHLTIKLPL